MAINKKLIHFNHKEDFLREKDTNNNILDTSIVFIKDTQELWTHGQFYSCLSDKFLDLLNGIYSNTYVTVDLGLPSGTLWANRNISAVNEYDGGKLFQWGDPTPYDVPKHDSEGNILTGEKQFNTSDYKWYPTGDNDNPSKYNYPDKKLILDLEDDPASINMGYNWNAPTIDNMKELLENTYQELYTNINGSTIKVASGTYDSSTKKGTWEYIDSYNSSMIISGNSYIKLVSKINSNFIIIPYWHTCSRGSCMTGTMLTTNKRASISDLNLIEAVSFNNTSYQIADVYERNIGMSVRGVTTSLSIINRYLADVRNTKLSYIDGVQLTPNPVIIRYKNYEKDQYGNKGEDKTIVIPPAQSGRLSGVMTGSDKAKLDGIAQHADVSPVKSVNGRIGVVTGLAEASNVYTKSEVDQKVADAVTGGQIDLSGYLTKTEAEDTYLTPTGLDQVLYDQSGDEGTTFGSTVADVNNLKDGIKNVYTKTESDSKYQPKGNYLTEHQDISGKANVGDSYTKTESDAKYLTEHQDISNLATKDEVSAKANSNDVYTKSQVDDMYSNAEGALNTIDQHLQNVTPGLNHIPSGGSEKQVLAYQSDGKAKWETLSNILPGMEDMLSYGVRWTPSQIDPQVERIGNMNLHRTLPIQSEMKGCIYKPKTKELSYWLNENDWRFRKEPIEAWVHFETPTIAVILDYESYTPFDFAKGQYVKAKGHIGIITLVSTTSSGIELTIDWEEGSSIYPDIVTAGGLEIGSRLDGYDGEVMVHVPGFYIRSWEGENYNEVRISQTKIDSTWEYQPPCYVGAYRDTILVNKPQDMGYLTELGVVNQRHPISVANYNAYCRGGTNDASKDNLDDIFQRDLGKCITNFARVSLRAWARLSNKEIMSYIQYKNIIYWLYVIEYANFDSQATFTSELDSNGFHQGGLGNGITGVQNWNTFNGGCPICVNGYTNNLGNRSGIKLILSDKINASSLSANRWRGIENPFGDVNTIVDGIISVDGNVYVTNNPELYTDSESDISNLTFIGTLPKTSASSMIREYSLGHTAELVVKHTSGSIENEGYKSDMILPGGMSELSFPTFGGIAYMTYQAGLGCQGWDSISSVNPQNGFRTIVVE